MAHSYCSACSHFAPDEDFPEITEAELLEEVEEGTIDNPDDLAALMERVGEWKCPECGQGPIYAFGDGGE